LLERDHRVSSGPWDPPHAGGLIVARDWCGASFGHGLIRFHDAASGPLAQENVESAFGVPGDQVGWVAFDWLGRQFGFVVPDGMGPETTMTVVADVGLGEFVTMGGAGALLECVVDGSIAENLNQSTFQEFRSRTGLAQLEFDSCVGFKHPPFLGGDTSLENLEVSDLDVYWTLLGQIYRQVADAPAGTVVEPKAPTKRRRWMGR
jgi:hypothetical protein